MRLIVFCLALLAATPALGLSCMRPDAVRMFEQARDADAAYYIVKGELSFLETPKTPPRNAKTPALTRARVTGEALSNSGFNASFDRDVTVEASCIGPWCGSPEGLSGPLIMALRIDATDVILEISACGGDQVPWTENAEERLLQCHLDDICIPAEF
ncbi:MAG: hypothetical protein AAFR73_09060 [Pseudomonadota bacterium]